MKRPPVSVFTEVDWKTDKAAKPAGARLALQAVGHLANNFVTGL